MEELRKIKKLYGEQMSHYCREIFPTILENEGVLLGILTKHFHPSRALYEDLFSLSQIDQHQDILNEFKSYIFTKFNRFQVSVSSTKSPKELLEEVGYDLYECKTNEDVQKFKKYYAPGEALCTFNRDRTERCHVFFAVKKNVDEIKRVNFKTPKRQDEYGTSVISIQFTKDESCILSIKNRYNHTVESCDATFSNDLENIIPGLTDSFEKEYGLVQKFRQGQFEIPNYVQAEDGKFYKYHVEINNVYYCEDNIIIDNFKVKKFDKSEYLLIDYFLVDLVNKKIDLYDKYISESFHTLTDNISKIEILKEDKDKVVKITHSDGTYTNITLKDTGFIYGLESNHYKRIPNDFLKRSISRKKVTLYNTVSIENHFLYETKEIEELNCPDTLEIGNSCLTKTMIAENVNLPKIKKIGNDFFKNNHQIDNLTLPEVELIGNSCFAENIIIDNISMPKVKEIGNLFFYRSNGIKEINLPEVLIVGDNFLLYGSGIEKVYMPKVVVVGDSFILSAKKLNHIELNSLRKCGNKFMACAEELESGSFDSLEIIGDSFLLDNEVMRKISLPNAISIGSFFMGRNTTLNEINIPLVTYIGEFFLNHNTKIKIIDLPNVKIIKNNFIYRTTIINFLNIPLIEEVGEEFLSYATLIDEAYIPNDISDNKLKPLQDWIDEKELIYDKEGYYRSMTYKEYHKMEYKKGR